nr:hypothetical protein [Tanacetum cinerariifolium]
MTTANDEFNGVACGKFRKKVLRKMTPYDQPAIAVTNSNPKNTSKFSFLSRFIYALTCAFWKRNPKAPVTVGHAHTPTTVDIESEPEDAPSKIEKSLALVFRAPLTDEEFEPSEPSNTRTTSSHSSALSDSTAPTARMTVRAQPVMSPSLSTRVTEVMTLSDLAFRKRYRSSYETPSPSLTLSIQKMYRGTSELISDIETEDDESKAEGAGSRSEESRDESSNLEEEAALEGHQQAVLVVGTVADEPLGLGYEALRRFALVPTSPSPEWSSGSLPVSPSSLVVPGSITSNYPNNHYIGG